MIWRTSLMAVVVACTVACRDRAAVTTTTTTAVSATTARSTAPPAQPAPVAEEVHRVGGDVLAPAVIERVEPRTTPEMRCRGLVIAEVIIDATGRVTEARDITPSPDAFTAAHIEAMGSWRFRPATRNGRPVAVRYNLTVHNRCA